NPAMSDGIEGLLLPGWGVPRVRPALGGDARCPDDRRTEAGTWKSMPRDSTAVTGSACRSRSGRRAAPRGQRGLIAADAPTSGVSGIACMSRAKRPDLLHQTLSLS